jgi:hypothetical protein
MTDLNPFTQYAQPRRRRNLSAQKRKKGRVTTQALGEEGGSGSEFVITTQALGEEGGNDWDLVVTTQALGEEGGSARTPIAVEPITPYGGQGLGAGLAKGQGWPGDAFGGVPGNASPFPAQTPWPAPPLS